MKSIAIIPARSGSKGIPGKNHKMLHGKPLVAYTLEAAICSDVDDILVTTDCDIVTEIATSYGVGVVRRPSELAGDSSSTLSALQHALEQTSDHYDAVVTLQPTSPLREADDINRSLELFFSTPGADSLVSVVEVPHNFHPQKIMRYNGQFLVGDNDVVRRQEIDPLYARNGAAIYITKYERIQDFVFGGNVIPFFMNKLKSLDIDDAEDWELASLLLKGLLQSK
ncbi:cytidylyltransferase domain-containing protein [Salinivibrio kushneri]|uniref:acylneuraminate cytidylyltransferase family protein n=1 Tax=Salinivibrio kushneri TaxID=1908198 RepID=UPI0009890004|nr:acylneuraminate cytidylyltransferase family protein [Salinivibrio kushneri]